MAPSTMRSHVAPPGRGEEALIELIGVTKTYHKGSTVITVFDDLDLTVAEGEFLSVVGPSGTGKSTLLHLLGGLDGADRGDVRVGGECLNAMGDGDRTLWRSRHVGFVFQQYYLIPVLTAAENVGLPLQLFHMTRRERRRRVALVLDLVGLTDRADHRPGQLSGGQEQRVAIARAVVTDPALILADEPTGDLDGQSATQVMELLSMLLREMGKTIVMVTHDSRAAAFSSRCCRLERGTLENHRSNGDGVVGGAAT